MLCPLAPNNVSNFTLKINLNLQVNTMAGAAIAAHNLGFDGTMAKLIGKLFK